MTAVTDCDDFSAGSGLTAASPPNPNFPLTCGTPYYDYDYDNDYDYDYGYDYDYDYGYDYDYDYGYDYDYDYD